MNRLVIIGNGFDLAHGLPTSYKDFIQDYLCNAINNFFREHISEDQLISIKYTQSRFYPDDTEVIGYDSAIEKINRFKDDKNVDFKYKSSLFERLIKNINDLNWVDVENEYFSELMNCQFSSGEFNFIKVNKLNSEFHFVKNLLEIYLSKTEKEFNKPINPHKYSRIFKQNILKDEVLLRELDNDILPDHIQILNFNFTNTIESSISQMNDIPTEVNYIHGELNYPENPLIFGFGDEYDKNYNDFEAKKNNSLFEHIKSFGYFKTKNYHNLIRFLGSDEFQVYIIGHSCGLSDRTMLKQIFENDNCVSIKIFYHQKTDGTNDYRERTFEISRHFEDKGLMRKKIVPFPLSKSM